MDNVVNRYGGYVPSWSRHPLETHCGPTKPVPIADRHLPSQPPKVVEYGQTLYKTDTAALSRRTGFEKAKVAPQAQTKDVPPTKQFVGSSLSKDASATVISNPRDPSFYSKMVKDAIKAEVSQPEELDRKADAVKNCRRARGGASGLACLHQAPKVSEMSDVLLESPHLAQESSTYTKEAHETTRPICNFTSNTASDYVKFLGRDSVASTYNKDFGTRGSNPRHRMPNSHLDMADMSVTCDLAAGTAKSMTKIRIPGYTGHCPIDKSNITKINGDDDAVAKFHKANLLVTTKHGMPGYGGYQPHSIYNDSGKPIEPEPHLSTTGTFSKYVADDNVEKAMNVRQAALSNEIKHFFSQGEGNAGIDCDFYYVNFRPMEGMMKHGLKDDQKWISDKELRRNYITRD
uniref:Uncharacterized protein n=1 Tax=Eutreptiella gymnastica TaxID=73025 RepID=A0A7S1NPD7_9EUGL|mmetsp:Transcript_60693/g.108251  ORF Transcript_60693/g.108251 Transcript_60693/m.108251 type:complete len:403 (+) Transcript_60693:67-1275(+)